MQHLPALPLAVFGKGDVTLVFASGAAQCTILADRATLFAESAYYKLAFGHPPAPRQFVYSASMLDGMLAFLKALHVHEPLVFADIGNVLSLGTRYRWLAHQFKGNIDGVIDAFESQPVSLALLLQLVVEHKLACTLQLLPTLVARRMVFSQSDAVADAWQHALDSLPDKDARVLELNKALRRSLVVVARATSIDDDASDNQSASSGSASTADSDSVE